MDTPDIETSSRQKAPKRVFFAAVVVIFVLTLAAADSIGFVPNYIDGSTSGTGSKIALSNLPQLGLPAQAGEENETGTLPHRIVISAINMDLPIQNPATKDIGALTEVLKSGPARYVDSAKLGEKGNMLLFGHSSQLPVVRNQMYKAFNNISKLEEGDANEDVIDLSRTKGTRLTLITCNTLGEKTARWIVEAELVLAAS